MAVAVRSLFQFWSEFSGAVRRFPMLDYVLATVLIGWGSCALIEPRNVIHFSKFGSLSSCILPAGALVLMSGSAQAIGCLSHHLRLRRLTAFVALWAMMSLWFAVGSITGKICWGGDVVLDLMICLALVP